MHKVAYNEEDGVFAFSTEAIEWLKKREYILPKDYEYYRESPCRHHPLVIECIETLKERAGGKYASLAVKEITGNQYYIDYTEYYGESVIEPHDINWITIE